MRFVASLELLEENDRYSKLFGFTFLLSLINPIKKLKYTKSLLSFSSFNIFFYKIRVSFSTLDKKTSVFIKCQRKFYARQITIEQNCTRVKMFIANFIRVIHVCNVFDRGMTQFSIRSSKRGRFSRIQSR